MIRYRRLYILGTVLIFLSALVGCDLIVASSPFAAPGDSLSDGDGTDPTPEPDGSDDEDEPADFEPSEILLAYSGTNLLVAEGGTTSAINTTLGTEPLDEVNVTLTPGSRLSLGAGAGVPITQQFSPDDWDIPQSVVVSAVNDGVLGGFTDTITVSTTSPDPSFEALSTSVTVIIEDDERTDTIYAVADDLLYKLDDMTGSNQATYDGTAGGGTEFSLGLSGVWVDGTQIYTVDGNNARAYRFDNMAGDNQAEYGGPLTPGVEFDSPQGISVYLGQIYVSDFTTNRIYQLDDVPPVNAPVEYNGSGATAFSNPRDVALDSLGRIYVVDRINKVVQRSDDMNGTNQVQYAAPGSISSVFVVD